MTYFTEHQLSSRTFWLKKLYRLEIGVWLNVIRIPSFLCISFDSHFFSTDSHRGKCTRYDKTFSPFRPRQWFRMWKSQVQISFPLLYQTKKVDSKKSQDTNQTTKCRTEHKWFCTFERIAENIFILSFTSQFLILEIDVFQDKSLLYCQHSLLYLLHIGRYSFSKLSYTDHTSNYKIHFLLILL